MKSLFVFFSVCFFTFSALGQNSDVKEKIPNADLELKVVDVSCGKCKFGMDAKTCELAVRIDGKSYFVDGASIDDYGDAHAHDGMCNAVRKAEVQGEMANNRFNASYIKLMPMEKKAKKAKN